MTLHFETKTLYLRPFEVQDAPVLSAYLNQPWLAGRRYLPEAYPSHLPLSRGRAEALVKTWEAQEHGITLAKEVSHGA